MSININTYKGLINKILSKYNLSLENILIIDHNISFSEYCKNNSINIENLEENPNRLAMSTKDRISKKPYIFIKEVLDDQFIYDAKIRIGIYNKIRGFELKTDIKFLTHLILHEIAHTKNIVDEDEADEWAFEQMKSQQF